MSQGNGYAVDVSSVRKVYRRDTQDIVVLDGLSLTIQRGRVRRADGPVRLGQDDAAQPDRGDRSADVRQGGGRRHRRRRG